MSVTMLAKQFVDGKEVGIGEVVTSDTTTEAALVAHGLATAIEDIAKAAKPPKE
jgi:hypothetical protein